MLIERCWSEDPGDRPTFDEIVDELETNPEFITDFVDKEEYFNYIDLVNQNNSLNLLENKSESNKELNTKIVVIYENGHKINENDFQRIDENEFQRIDENEISNNSVNIKSSIRNIINSNENEIKSSKVGDISFINQSIKKSLKFNQQNEVDVQQPDFDLINQLISSNQSTKLIHYLNDNCDYDTTSKVFDQCLIDNPNMYDSICKEGILLHNAVSLHKTAISLIFDSKDKRKVNENFEKARNYLNEAIQKGYLLSYFLLARILNSFYGENKKAFEVASEGAVKGEKYSKCLLGHFIANGIGTEKNRKKGVSMMLESGAEDFYTQFATEIGLYYLELDVKNESNAQNAFKWFEKAYSMNKSRTTINNFGLCFLKGVYVEKNLEKAREIFDEGVKIGDPNSMYHIAFIFEDIDLEKSLFYYRKASELGNSNAKARYEFLKINKKTK